MQYFCKHFTSTHLNAISLTKWQIILPACSLSDGRLSVLNNELFSGHVGLLYFSPGFSDLSAIGAITCYCQNWCCNDSLCAADFKSQASQGKVDNSSCLIRFPQALSGNLSLKMGNVCTPIKCRYVNRDIDQPSLSALDDLPCVTLTLQPCCCLCVVLSFPHCVWLIHMHVHK